VHRRQPAGCCALGTLALGVPAAGAGGGSVWAHKASTKGPIPMDSESKRELWIVTAVALAPIPLLTALAVIAALQ
jgi:hypothetical protein